MQDPRLYQKGRYSEERLDGDKNERDSADQFELPDLQAKSESLWLRYQHTGDSAILSEKLALDRQILSLSPKEYPFRAKDCETLAVTLKAYYKHTNDLGLLHEAVTLEREALASRPTGDLDRVSTCTNLALSLKNLFECLEDKIFIEEAIGLQREALSLCVVGDRHRALCCGNLAVSLKELYELTGNSNSLQEALEHDREALLLRPTGHPHRAISCTNLASSLTILYRRLGGIEHLTEATTLHREVLSLRPSGHPDRVITLGDLAGALQFQFRSLRDLRFLEEAIDLQREALSLCRDGKSERASCYVNLASSLLLRYGHGGEGRFLDESIALGREALTTCSTDRSHRAELCEGLADSLATRYENVGDITLLNEAIVLYREGILLRPKGHKDRAFSCENLAVLLGTHYGATESIDSLNDTVMLLREALSLRPPGHPARAVTCANLTSALGQYFERTQDTSTLLEAISLQREGYSLCPAGHPDRAISSSNLASSLVTYSLHVGDQENLAEARELLLEACQLAPPHSVWKYAWNLARLYLLQGTTLLHIQAAVQCLLQSLNSEPDNPAEAVTRNLDLLTRIFRGFRESADESHHQLLAPVYESIVRLLPLLVNPALRHQTQLQILMRYSQLGSDAFVNAHLGNNYTKGLELLEIVQGIFWSQKMYRRDPYLRDVPKKLAAEIEQLLQDMSSNSLQSSHVASLMPQTSELQDMIYSRNNRLNSLIRDVRHLPGMDRFMLGETYQSLLTVASVSHPVVVLVGACDLFYALIIKSPSTDQNTVLAIDVTQESLERLILLHDLKRSHRGARPPGDLEWEDDERGMKVDHIRSPLESYLKYIWLKIVQPVITNLGLQMADGHARPRLHWCPTGIFSSLPLHAAGAYDGQGHEKMCCADYVVSSYSPTLTSLLRARRTLTSLARDSLALMLVAEKRAYDRNLLTIPGVELEINSVCSIADSSKVHVVHHQVGSTTVAASSAAMKVANVVHFACHGVQDVGDATQSGFCLGDGRLAISDLMELHLKDGFLAFLSACETATGSKEQPDQAMHLAAAMLFTGFKNVIASMWAISDTDGPRIAEWFYSELFEHEIIDADTVARALDVAVCKLRGAGVPADRWAPFIHMGA